MAVTQRITGGDDPGWPDERVPVPRRMRRRWRWMVAAAAILVGSACVYLAGTRHPPEVVNGLGCYSGGGQVSNIDYAVGTGSATPSEAVHAFLSTSLAKGYPRSGYSTTSRVVVANGIVWSATKGTTYVHRTHGRIDALLAVESVGSVWQVTETRTCA